MKTGQGFKRTLNFDHFSSCLAHQAGVMVSWVASTRSQGMCKKHPEHSATKASQKNYPSTVLPGENTQATWRSAWLTVVVPPTGDRQWPRARAQPCSLQREPPWVKEPEVASWWKPLWEPILHRCEPVANPSAHSSAMLPTPHVQSPAISFPPAPRAFLCVLLGTEPANWLHPASSGRGKATAQWVNQPPVSKPGPATKNLLWQQGWDHWIAEAGWPGAGGSRQAVAQESAACTSYANAKNETPEKALNKPPAAIPLSSSRECWDCCPAYDRATLSLSTTNHPTTNLEQVKIPNCLASSMSGARWRKQMLSKPCSLLSPFSPSPDLIPLPLHQCPAVPIDFDSFLWPNMPVSSNLAYY